LNAFVSGGYLPESRRGQKETRLIAGHDWLMTYAKLTGALDAASLRYSTSVDEEDENLIVSQVSRRRALSRTAAGDRLIDHQALQYGLPDFDGINQWGVISGIEPPKSE